MKTQKEENHALEQAKAQLKSVRGMVAALRMARHRDDDDAMEKARDAINEDALSVDVRTGWQSPGAEPLYEEYRILLCTGGPAVQIVGELDQWNQPHTARIQYQDWFTGWNDLNIRESDESALIEYAQQFYFGE